MIRLTNKEAHALWRTIEIFMPTATGWKKQKQRANGVKELTLLGRALLREGFD